MKNYFFISGLPRSGSTLLSTILKQNPEFYADISSPLSMITENTVRVFTECENGYHIDDERRIKVIQGFFEGYYSFFNGSTVFDTSRSWTRNTSLLKQVFSNTKVICCVRNVEEIINSFEKLWLNNPLYYKQINDFTYSQNIFERSDEIYNRSIIPHYSSLKEGYAKNPEMIHFIEYESLCKFPEKVMKDLYKFIGIDYYSHNFNQLDYENEQFDLKSGVPNIHKIKPVVYYEDCKYYIPEEIKQKYQQMRMEFWRPYNQSQGLIAVPQNQYR
jgi:sulfotransferase